MKKPALNHFSLIAAGLLTLGLLCPVSVSAKPPKNTATTPAPATDATTPAPAVSTPPATDSAAAPATAPAAVPVTSSAPKTPAEAATDSVTAGDLTLSHASIEQSHGNIDLFLTIKNNGKVDEKITGFGTSWTVGDTVQVTKNKEGKETESPATIDIPAGKSVDISKDSIWLRLKDVKDIPKGATVIPMSFYFRHSPNANLKISMSGKSAGIMGWFKN